LGEHKAVLTLGARDDSNQQNSLTKQETIVFTVADKVWSLPQPLSVNDPLNDEVTLTSGTTVTSIFSRSYSANTLSASIMISEAGKKAFMPSIAVENYGTSNVRGVATWGQLLTCFPVSPVAPPTYCYMGLKSRNYANSQWANLDTSIAASVGYNYTTNYPNDNVFNDGAFVVATFYDSATNRTNAISNSFHANPPNGLTEIFSNAVYNIPDTGFSSVPNHLGPAYVGSPQLNLDPLSVTFSDSAIDIGANFLYVYTLANADGTSNGIDLYFQYYLLTKNVFGLPNGWLYEDAASKHVISTNDNIFEPKVVFDNTETPLVVWQQGSSAVGRRLMYSIFK